jgi:hypothetical protein
MTAYTNQHSAWSREDLIALYSCATSGESVKKLVRRFGRSPQAIQTALRKILSVQLACYSKKEVAQAMNVDPTYLKNYIADEKYNVSLEYSEHHPNGIGCYPIIISSFLIAGALCSMGILSNQITNIAYW